MELNGKFSKEIIQALVYLSLLDLEALKNFFTSVNIWSFDVTEEITAGTSVEIPEYAYSLSSIIVMLNGLASLDFDKVPPTEGSKSSSIKFKNTLVVGTKVIGITFTTSDTGGGGAEIVVQTDSTLIGSGMLTDPLGINPSILEDITKRINDVAATINVNFNNTVTGKGTVADPFSVSSTITNQIANNTTNITSNTTKITENTTAITSLKATVDALPTIAKIIEEINKATEEKTFLSKVTVETTATGGTLKSETLSNKGTTGTLSATLPIVSATLAGLAPASMHTKIESMQSQIDALSGTAVFIIDDTLASNSTQAQLNASWVAGGKTLTEGAIIENWILSIRWVYKDGTWLGPYSFSGIAIATTTTVGAVLSSEDREDNRGQITVELDGVMSLIGYDNIISNQNNITSKLDAAILRLDAIEAISPLTGSRRIWSAVGSVPLPYTAGSSIEVPIYVLEKGSLDVYINGIRTDQFSKVDTTKIKIDNDIAGTGTIQLLVDYFSE